MFFIQISMVSGGNVVCAGIPSDALFGVPICNINDVGAAEGSRFRTMRLGNNLSIVVMRNGELDEPYIANKTHPLQHKSFFSGSDAAAVAEAAREASTSAADSNAWTRSATLSYGVGASFSGADVLSYATGSALAGGGGRAPIATSADALAPMGGGASAGPAEGSRAGPSLAGAGAAGEKSSGEKGSHTSPLAGGASSAAGGSNSANSGADNKSAVAAAGGLINGVPIDPTIAEDPITHWGSLGMFAGTSVDLAPSLKAHLTETIYGLTDRWNAVDGAACPHTTMYYHNALAEIAKETFYLGPAHEVHIAERRQRHAARPTSTAAAEVNADDWDFVMGNSAVSYGGGCGGASNGQPLSLGDAGPTYAGVGGAAGLLAAGGGSSNNNSSNNHNSIRSGAAGGGGGVSGRRGSGDEDDDYGSPAMSPTAGPSAAQSPTGSPNKHNHRGPSILVDASASSSAAVPPPPIVDYVPSAISLSAAPAVEQEANAAEDRLETNKTEIVYITVGSDMGYSTTTLLRVAAILSDVAFFLGYPDRNEGHLRTVAAYVRRLMVDGNLSFMEQSREALHRNVASMGGGGGGGPFAGDGGGPPRYDALLREVTHAYAYHLETGGGDDDDGADGGRRPSGRRSGGGGRGSGGTRDSGAAPPTAAHPAYSAVLMGDKLVAETTPNFAAESMRLNADSGSPQADDEAVVWASDKYLVQLISAAFYSCTTLTGDLMTPREWRIRKLEEGLAKFGVNRNNVAKPKTREFMRRYLSMLGAPSAPASCSGSGSGHLPQSPTTAGVAAGFSPPRASAATTVGAFDSPLATAVVGHHRGSVDAAAAEGDNNSNNNRHSLASALSGVCDDTSAPASASPQRRDGHSEAPTTAAGASPLSAVADNTDADNKDEEGLMHIRIGTNADPLPRQAKPAEEDSSSVYAAYFDELLLLCDDNVRLEEPPSSSDEEEDGGAAGGGGDLNEQFLQAGGNESPSAHSLNAPSGQRMPSGAYLGGRASDRRMSTNHRFSVYDPTRASNLSAHTSGGTRRSGQVLVLDDTLREAMGSRNLRASMRLAASHGGEIVLGSSLSLGASGNNNGNSNSGCSSGMSPPQALTLKKTLKLAKTSRKVVDNIVPKCPPYHDPCRFLSPVRAYQLPGLAPDLPSLDRPDVLYTAVIKGVSLRGFEEPTTLQLDFFDSPDDAAAAHGDDGEFPIGYSAAFLYGDAPETYGARLLSDAALAEVRDRTFTAFREEHSRVLWLTSPIVESYGVPGLIHFACVDRRQNNCVAANFDAAIRNATDPDVRLGNRMLHEIMAQCVSKAHELTAMGFSEGLWGHLGVQFFYYIGLMPSADRLTVKLQQQQSAAAAAASANPSNVTSRAGSPDAANPFGSGPFGGAGRTGLNAGFGGGSNMLRGAARGNAFNRSHYTQSMYGEFNNSSFAGPGAAASGGRPSGRPSGLAANLDALASQGPRGAAILFPERSKLPLAAVQNLLYRPYLIPDKSAPVLAFYGLFVGAMSPSEVCDAVEMLLGKIFE